MGTTASRVRGSAIALAVAYEATGEQKYRDAALQYARAGTRAHPVPEHIDRDWKLGILADGVSYVQAINPDPALSAWLKLYAATALKSQAADSRFYPAVAYVGRVNKDEKLLQAARIAANRIRFGSWAKPFTIATRTGFRILSQVDAAP